MEQENMVSLDLDIGSELHRQLVEYCERTGQTLEQGLSTILREKLGIAEDPVEEVGPQALADLDWQAMIPFARKINMGKVFNIYDIAIRMHSHHQFSSIKVPGFWHSAFAQWVRRHNEFRIIPAQNGNMFQRISAEEAPVPKARRKPKKSERYAAHDAATATGQGAAHGGRVETENVVQRRYAAGTNRQ